MSITKEYLIGGLVPVALLALNARATWLVLRDDLSDRSQRVAQLGIVWVLPLFGSLLVSALHRGPPASSGEYSTHLYYEDAPGLDGVGLQDGGAADD